MNNSQEIADIIRFQVSVKRLTISKMLTDIGLAKNTLQNMDNGSMIKADSLGKIADYLDCSVDYLLGRTKNSQSLSNNHINGVNETIAKRDKELLQKINNLSFDDYADVISYINSKFRNNI